MAAPKISLHARKVADAAWHPTYKCKYCKYTMVAHYNDVSNLRKHLRRSHPVEYMGDFIINEESDELWALAK